MRDEARGHGSLRTLTNAEREELTRLPREANWLEMELETLLPQRARQEVNLFHHPGVVRLDQDLDPELRVVLRTDFRTFACPREYYLTWETFLPARANRTRWLDLSGVSG